MRTKLGVALIFVILCTALSCKREELTAEERDMFVRGHDFSEEIGMSVEEAIKHEKFTKTKFFGGAVQIEYEFKPPEKFGTYMTETISFNMGSDSKSLRSIEDSTIGFVLQANGMEKVPVSTTFKYGDSSNFYALKKDGQTVGNYFTVMEKGNFYSLMVAGVSIDSEMLEIIVEPKLQLFSAYKPN
jgi:hypothetical protein